MQPYLFGKIIDMIGDKNYFYIIKNLFFMGVIMIISLSINVINTYINTKMSNDLKKSLKVKMLTKILNMNLKKFDSFQKGELIEKTDKDVGIFSDILTGELYSLIIDIGKVVFIGYILFKINFFMAMILILIFPLSLYINNIFGRILRKKQEKFKKQRDFYMNYFQEILNGFKTIKIFDFKSNILKNFENHLTKIFDLNLNIMLFSSFGGFIGNFIGITGNLLIILIGIKFIINGKITLGSLVAFNSYSGIFSNSLFKLSGINKKIQLYLVSINRVFEILINEEEINETKKYLYSKEFKEDIIIKNLYFKYNKKDEFILKINDMKFKKNKINVIKGINGSGKTTLACILSGLYNDYDGEIYVGKNELKTINNESILNNIIFITQDFYFFNGTILENLMLDKFDIDEKEIKIACNKANIDSYIEKLPLKYNTLIGYNGINFSEGQKQRLIFARALLRERQIYIFDEITSFLDNKSEKIILKSLKYLSKEKTIILISHKESVFKVADNLIEFDNDSRNSIPELKIKK
ncbi:ABC transporter ATP-binding protein/permease [Oceanotoga sp. DSM 15011]|uniref:ABC transporter transmembrane domain-containing protein n=1 Tax=Oceanotoga sp. DSM 15011 TaxID=2984951 RepID=UPI0021F47A0E|nr:ABC transporter ATP-binding protein [Oceanotoga sp. DSM 15011]UYP01306.1 ABC transporter ATP-binding protein/permease [Oceanotoga sp. DSM 15011]